MDSFSFFKKRYTWYARGAELLILLSAFFAAMGVFFLSRAYVHFSLLPAAALSAAVFFPLIVPVFFVRLSFARLRDASRAAEALKAGKDRYAAVVAGASEALWEWDPDSRAMYLSPFWYRMLGYEEGSVKTIDDWKKLVHPEDRRAVEMAMESHIAGETPVYKAEYRIRNAGGRYVWMMDRGRLIGGKEEMRFVGSARDIENIKRVEEVLQSRTEELERARGRLSEQVRNTRKFQQAVESATDAIVILSPEGEIVYANPSWEKLVGYSLAEARGRKFDFPYEKNTPKKIKEKMYAAMRAGDVFVTEEAVGEKKSGDTYAAEVALFPVKDAGRTIFHTFVQQDITKRKEIDRAKTEFVSLASHQLRTPLSAIRWYAEMLLDGSAGSLSDLQKKYVKEIYKANLRMIELVGALLNVSRIDLGTFAIDPSPVRLREVVDEALGELKHDIDKKNIRIAYTYDEKLPVIPLDRKLIRMVFQNLLSNAVKYTPAGGEIRIDIRRDGDRAVFRISDTGIGIPEKDKKRIFSKLFRADNAKEVDSGGTGLGLYIVKAIMERSGGDIRFESEEGKGTTFYGIIPLTGSPVRAGTKELSDVSSAPHAPLISK